MPSFGAYSKQMLWEDNMLTRQLEISGDVPEDVFIAFATYVQAHGGLTISRNVILDVEK